MDLIHEFTNTTVELSDEQLLARANQFVSALDDYKKITQKSFKEASAEDILEISKDFERVTKKYISDKNIE